jgi:O-antigen biosynthesis protein WbqP
MKRIFDILLSVGILIVLAIPMLLIAVLVRLTSKGPAIYWSKRVGMNGVIFEMPKFRSMQMDTPTVATHLMKKPDDFLSPIGAFLRRSSLDEVPQLFSILKGNMSFIGPRPALFNQQELILLRKKNGIDGEKPGITGWAQVNGRDELSIADKVGFDVEYVNNQSLLFDLKILWMTFVKVIKRTGVTH